MIILSLFEHFF